LRQGTVILGAGVSGLAASWASGAPAFEAAAFPGGICSSYYQEPGSPRRQYHAPQGSSAYHFENGGGHWIFGAEPVVRRFLARFSPLEAHRRQSAVYFPELDRYVSFPLQYHLGQLDPALGTRALEEMRRCSNLPAAGSLGDWLERTFGPTLCGLFFRPFHDLYTAGLTDEIAPQDGYKTPVDLAQVERGVASVSDSAGYNVQFLHPGKGLAQIVQGMAGGGHVECGKQAVAIDLTGRRVDFSDGSGAAFDNLICTLPLDRSLALCGLALSQSPDPYTSVLVLNAGGRKGPKHPPHHWLYVPNSKAGFHRVGIYSNVSRHFVPRGNEDLTSMYIERALPGGTRLTEAETSAWAASVVEELRAWGWLAEAEVLSPTWIDAAYTWRRPGSQWREAALALLDARGVTMAGRYACWRFQGIAESIRDGFHAGAALR
jgi:protoporphyrinogen oxidase